MKTIVLLLCAASALFADADGRWSAEIQSMHKKAGMRTSKPVSLDLHTSQGVLTGSVTRGKKAMNIENGRIDGTRITFVTVETTKNGSHSYSWEGTVKGDQITGHRRRDSAKRSEPFVAKRM